MVRVCHMTSAHRSDDGRIFKKECISLAKAGYEVFLVAPGESRLEGGVEVCGVGQGGGRLSRMLVTARKVYKAARELDADIYHFHDPELLPYGVALAKAGKSVIFDSHENYPSQILTKQYLPSGMRSMVSKLYERYETRACSRFAAAISPCTFAGVSVFEGRARRAALVGNGCLEDNLPPYESINFDRALDAVCCLGSLTYARGITHLVKAAFLADVRLILCGSISAAYLEELRAMPEFRTAEYRGMLPQTQLPAVMEECFAGVAAGLNVGQYGNADILPTKVSEYLLNGLPVILFETPFNRGFMEQCACGITVRMEDVDAFAAAIRRLKEDGDLRKDMAHRGRGYALQHLTWSHDEAQLLGLYDSIVGERGLSR